MACRVEANGTVLNCACSGCGIAYNHSTKKYHVLCCGEIFVLASKLDITDPDDPPSPGGVIVDLSDVLMIDAIKLFEEIAPGVEVDGGFKPGDRVTLRENKPLADIGRQLGIRVRESGPKQEGA